MLITPPQEHGTTFSPLTVEEAETVVRVLKRLELNGRPYYLALLRNAQGKLHTLADMPQTHRMRRTKKKFNIACYTHMYIRGDLGVIPADNIALLAPKVIPNIVYKFRPGRNNSLNFSVRQTLTNIEHHIVHQ